MFFGATNQSAKITFSIDKIRQQSETRNRVKSNKKKIKIDLADHLVLEELLFVENFNGEILTSLDVPSELDFGEIALPEGPTQLVPPDPCPASSACPRRHLQSLYLRLSALLSLSPQSFNFSLTQEISSPIKTSISSSCTAAKPETWSRSFFLISIERRSKSLIVSNPKDFRGSETERLRLYAKNESTRAG